MPVPWKREDSHNSRGLIIAKRLMAAGLAAAMLLWPPALPGATAGERPTTLVYTSTKLENGLWVVLHEDHSTPIVHVSVTYHVGSKNERPGRTGFAHLLSLIHISEPTRPY